MATVDDLRAIANSYPGVVEGTGSDGQVAFGLPVKGKSRGLCWMWMERVEPRQKRIPNPDIWAFRVASLAMKDKIHAENPPEWFVDDPHYANYPAVVVRLDAVEPQDLRRLFEDAWIVAG